jgi:hypothetical protein
MHEEASYRVSHVEAKELWAWDYSLCFLQERVPSVSPRETVRGHIASSLAVNRWVVFLP